MKSTLFCFFFKFTNCKLQTCHKFLCSSEDKMTELEDVLEAMTAPDLRNLAKSLRINTNGMPQKKLVQAVIGHSKQKTIGTLFSGNAANTAKMIFKRYQLLAIKLRLIFGLLFIEMFQFSVRRLSCLMIAIIMEIINPHDIKFI